MVRESWGFCGRVLDNAEHVSDYGRGCGRVWSKDCFRVRNLEKLKLRTYGPNQKYLRHSGTDVPG